MGIKKSSPVAVAPRIASGKYALPEASSFSTVLLTAARLFAVPVWLPRGFSWDRLRAEVTVVGTAGSVIRLGVYEDTGEGEPGARLLDAGTIDGTSATAQEVTIALGPLSKGLYWLALAGQGAPGTEPTVRTWNNPSAFGGRDGTLTGSTGGRFVAGVTGALPASFGAGTPSATIPVVGLRRA